MLRKEVANKPLRRIYAKKFADKLQKEGKLDVSIWEIPDYREVLPSHDKSDFAVIWTEILDQ